ncbi:hypothetical protein TVAG_189990 [Trichomonas vaginalis G3]|uniref:Uncharacterized protein n=1 Tax=Trichomonas vaginalis (strain ATCC PRA-98 / G3) TaxID=412133 RepID=A2DKD1_TRIV3|nr:hypothetical protein TVAGG3_0996200 [Trichomonas vaginalis G3]EAY19108.1 hypothetical protein TVAG_189990 [Trichomonas vaginalis G3]KAI5490406.1 hypothetical protein TVAGG3_0996200 [Trichomonas vaginalis G3]|eukprot:XP_001580094.1 hypothetical protein [Trichomonas vaginalis G3]
MTEGEHLSWLRGPLPPLSDAVLESHLVNPSHIVQKVHDSTPFRSPPSEKEEKSQRNKKPKALPKYDPVPPRSRTQLEPIYSTNPQVPFSYKPPPIESMIGGQPKVVTQFVKPPAFGNDGKIMLRQEIQQISSQLDEEIQKFMPINPANDKEKLEITYKLLQIHNIAMNQLILLDKTTCSERAILLRRLQTFYKEIIEDIPSYFTAYEQEIANLRVQLEELSKDRDKCKTESENLTIDIDSIKTKIETLQKQNEDLIKMSNDKDVEIQVRDDKITMLTVSLQGSQIQAKENASKAESFERMYHKSVEESKQQLEVIEKFSQQIKAVEDGNSGVVWDLRKAEVRIKELEQQNQALNRSVYNLQNVPKDDKCVDTSDLPPPPKSKKKKKPQNVATDSVGQIVQQAANIAPSVSIGGFAPLRGRIPSNVSLLQLSSGGNSTNPFISEQPSMVRRASNKDKETQTDKIETSEIEVQTDPVNIIMLPEEKEEKQEEEEKHEGPATEMIVENIQNETILDIWKVDFNRVNGYDITKEELDKIPDLFPTLVPVFGQPFKSPETRELDRLNIGKLEGVKRQDRPLVWAFQLIHNFLTDTFVRSVEAMQLQYGEAIFVEWLSRQFRLPHIVNQICADVSLLLFTTRNVEPFMKFFSNMMENFFTYPQICFISLLYSFTVNLTYPNLLKMIQDYNLAEEHTNICIHMRTAFTVLSRCLSPGLASTFIRQKVMPEQPMWKLFDFMTQSATFFLDKHQHIYQSTVSILQLCGHSSDSSLITYDVFNKFMCLMDSVQDHSKWWNNLMQQNHTSGVDMLGLISICAERKRPLIELFRLDNMKPSMDKFKGLSTALYEYYMSFIERFAVTIPKILDKSPAQLLEKLERVIPKIRNDLLTINFASFSWHYRVFLNITDTTMLNVVHQIPFRLDSDDKTYKEINDYFTMCERVSFALFE